jgi:diguanylate cyclase (GGDEF)-like protein
MQEFFIKNRTISDWFFTSALNGVEKMRTIRQSKLFNQLVIMMTLLLLAALMIPSLFAQFIIVPRVVEGRYYQAMKQDVSYLESTLKGSLDKGLQDVEFLAGLEAFHDLEDSAGMAELFKLFIAANHIFTGAIVTNAQGDMKLFYSSSGRTHTGEHNIIYRDYIYKPLTTGSSYVSDLVITAVNQVPLVFISTPLVKEGETIGVLALSINLWNKDNLFYRVFNNFIENRTGEIYLVDKLGQVVYHRNKELLGAKLDNEAVSQVVAGHTVLVEKDVSKGQIVAAYARSMKNLGWGIVREVTYQEIYQSTNIVRSVIGITTAIVLVAGVAASFFIAGVILRPLDLLNRTIEAVAAGNLNQELGLKGHDDMHRLFNNFNQMLGSLKSQKAELERLSLEDYLTGLANRRYLEQHLRLEMDRVHRLGHNSAVIMLDIDDFKRINDFFGHLEGDRVLKSLADVLRANLRLMDLPARFGGEEFVVILPETSLNEGIMAAEKICQKVREIRLKSRKGEIHFTISAGVAGTEQLTFPHEPDEVLYDQLATEILQKADEAMYLAKSCGKNKACCSNS